MKGKQSKKFNIKRFAQRVNGIIARSDMPEDFLHPKRGSRCISQARGIEFNYFNMTFWPIHGGGLYRANLVNQTEATARRKAKRLKKTIGKTYQPSNGTEGAAFIEKWCSHCIHEKWMHTFNDNDAKCEVLSNTFVEDDYSQWIYDETGSPTCKCHKHWDWGFDDDGNSNNEPPIIEPDDPMQLVMPFIIEQTFKERELCH